MSRKEAELIGYSYKQTGNVLDGLYIDFGYLVNLKSPFPPIMASTVSFRYLKF